MVRSHSGARSRQRSGAFKLIATAGDLSMLAFDTLNHDTSSRAVFVLETKQALITSKVGVWSWCDGGRA